MTAAAIQNPLPNFIGLDGLPLSLGTVYFGEPFKDPRNFPQSVFYDDAMTIPAPAHLSTRAGYLWRNGTPTNVYLNGSYSILVLDAVGRQVFYVASWNGVSSANLVFVQGGTGALTLTVQGKLRRIVHASDFCVMDGVTDDAPQLQRASQYANSVDGRLILDGVAYIKTQPALSGYIEGVPGISRIKVAPDFVFPAGSDPFNKSAIVTPNRALAYDDTTADYFYMNGVDLEWAYTAGAQVSPTLLLLTNIKAGAIENCRAFTPVGGWRCDALIDLYACVKNFSLLNVDARNLTALPKGGACWIRNITSDGSNTNNTTENIVIDDHCFFGTTTGDEAISIFGVHGVVKDVRVTGATTISSLTSAQKHGTLASVFPLNDGSANGIYAAVKNILFDNVKFFSDNFDDHLFRVGRTGDEANRTEGVRAVNCQFHGRQSAVRTSYIARNIAGIGGGNEIIDSHLTTSGSPQQITHGVLGFDRFDGGTVGSATGDPLPGGNFAVAIEACGLVQNNPRIQSSAVAVRNCRQTTGNSIFAATDGVLCEGTEDYTVANNDITLTATSGAFKCVKVNTVLGSAPTAEVVENRFHLNNASALCVDTSSVPNSTRVFDNRSYGTGGQVSGTVAEQAYNNWYGVPEGPARPPVTAMTDANLTLTAANRQVVILDVPLTADRTLTMPSTGAVNSDEVLVIRTSNSTGAFNLIVASSPGKTVATGGHAHAFRASSLWKAA